MASENNFDQSQLIEVFSKSPGPIRVFLSYENEDNDIAKAIHESLFELSFYTPKEYAQADLASGGITCRYRIGRTRKLLQETAYIFPESAQLGKAL